jgi:hypothetical protein
MNLDLDNQLTLKNLIMNDFLLSVSGNVYFTCKEINSIREFAMTKGGFLNNNLRRIIWKKLFCINEKELNFNLRNKSSKIKLKKISQITKGNFHFEEILEEFKSPKLENHPEVFELIKRDVQRSAINDLNLNSNFKNSYIIEKNLDTYKNELLDFLFRIFSLDKFRYDYYQGYHDLILFIYLLYSENERLAFVIAQRINEMYLKDYLDENNKNFILSVLSLLKETFNKINKKVYQEISEEDPTENYANLCISWVICLFAQKIKNSEKVYRILDYLFCSHPLAIYHMVSNVKSNFYNKIILDFS